MGRSMLVMTLLLTGGAIGLAAGDVQAQSKPIDAESARKQAALKFASRHHPELATLLKRLKTADKKAFEKAVRDISQSRERLSRLEEHDPQRYELALRIWTLDSRIRLLAARSTMSDDASIDDRLRELLRERRQARLSMLRFEHKRLEARIDRVEDQIGQLEQNGDDAVENDLARIKRAVASNRNRKAPGKRPRNQSQNDKAPERASSSDGETGTSVD